MITSTFQDFFLPIRLIIIFFFFILNSNCYAGSNEFILQNNNLFIIAPPVVNKDYYLIEFGFITEKNFMPWSYKYNAYATVNLFQDWLGKDQLRAGALGFKGGVMLPTQPWIPLLFTGSIGFAKTALHKSPFLGKEELSVAQKDMFLLEAGALYHYEGYFIRVAYQRSNVKYFTRHFLLMMGVNY